MRVAPLIQAQATVRIVRGVTVQLGRETTTDGQQLRSTQVATADGTQPARLIEFQ